MTSRRWASVLFAVVVSIPALSHAQDDKAQAEPEEKTAGQSDPMKNAGQSDHIEFDLSFDYDPDELREHWVDWVRTKRIWGPFGLAGYHIFPAAETGPWLGPPTRFWGNGFGTSLWRNPVTGWPEQ